jgi:hypothetical protein
MSIKASNCFCEKSVRGRGVESCDFTKAIAAAMPERIVSMGMMYGLKGM